MGTSTGHFSNNLIRWMVREGAADEELLALDWREMPALLMSGEMSAEAFEVIRTALLALDSSVSQNGGAVVKTVEEGIIATFSESRAAVAAAIDIQRGLRQRQDDHPLAMRAAIHRGPAMVTTLNDRLDYFGSTVHITHRLLELASAGDLMVTDAVAGSREISQLLDEAMETAQVVPTVITDVIVQRYRC